MGSYDYNSFSSSSVIDIFSLYPNLYYSLKSSVTVDNIVMTNCSMLISCCCLERIEMCCLSTVSFGECSWGIGDIGIGIGFANSRVMITMNFSMIIVTIVNQANVSTIYLAKYHTPQDHSSHASPQSYLQTLPNTLYIHMHNVHF